MTMSGVPRDAEAVGKLATQAEKLKVSLTEWTMG